MTPGVEADVLLGLLWICLYSDTVTTVPHQDDSYASVPARTNSKQRRRPGLGAPRLGVQRFLLPDRQD